MNKWIITILCAAFLVGGCSTVATGKTMSSKLPSCIPKELKSKLSQVERKFGKVTVISTYRKGAKVKGTGRPSKHASCRAIDFIPQKGKYRATAKWLKANHKGGVGTYSGRFHHIHIDNGRRARWHN